MLMYSEHLGDCFSVVVVNALREKANKKHYKVERHCSCSEEVRDVVFSSNVICTLFNNMHVL